MNCSKNDFEFGKILPRFTQNGKVPAKYCLDGVEYEGIPEEFGPEYRTERIDTSITRTVVTGKTPAGLALRAECTEYADFPVTEWVMYITNESTANSAVISDWRLTAAFPACDKCKAVLYHGNGDNCNPSGYSWQEDELTGEALEISPCGDGTSCNGAFPYMRLKLPGGGVNLAVGWTGTWKLKAGKCCGNASVEVSQLRFNTYLEPGETVRTPSLILEAYAGDENRARNLWRSWYFAHVLPREKDGRPLGSKLVVHTWMIDGLPEFCGVTEENQKKAIDTYLERGIKPDIWWIDAGWYPCDNNWPGGVGNWYPHPEHFPNGMGPVGEKCEKEGIDLLVWFEPERVVRNTKLWREHPEFLIKGSDEDINSLLYLGNPEALAWITDKVDSLIKESHIKVYRQDFNFAPAGYWAKGEAENRTGIHENLHIQGYYAYWDALLLRNPGLLIDSCASGGRRNDIETMKRAVPLHYTDVGYGEHPIKQKQHRQMFEWIPYFRAHTFNWDTPEGTYGGKLPVDEFAYQNALAPSVTSMIEWNDPEELYAVGRRFHPVWRKAAEIELKGDYYPLTETRGSKDDWYAMQFECPAAPDGTADGFVQIIRNIGVNEPEITVKPYVAPENLNRTYRFELAFTGEVREMTGKTLAENGFADNVPARTGRLWFYTVKD